MELTTLGIVFGEELQVSNIKNSAFVSTAMFKLGEEEIWCGWSNYQPDVEDLFDFDNKPNAEILTKVLSTFFPGKIKEAPSTYINPRS